MSCTFISSCFKIFDLGHQAYILLTYSCDPNKKKKNWTKEQLEEYKMRRSLSMYKDRWYFDLGSEIAFTSVIYLIIVLFSTIAPLITIFGGLFFGIKYLIDKYNVCYIFPTENIGNSSLMMEICRLQYIAMFI